MKELLKNIRVTRVTKGFSQMYVAGKLKIDYSTYGKIERGQIALTVERMEQIAKILEVEVSEIYPKVK